MINFMIVIKVEVVSVAGVLKVVFLIEKSFFYFKGRLPVS